MFSNLEQFLLLEIKLAYFTNFKYFNKFHLFYFITVLGFIYFYNKNRHLPPGPWGLPFIGVLRSLKSNIHQNYLDLSRKYGKIFSIKIGQKTVVIISDAKIMREAFIKEEFSGRPNNEFLKLIGGYGIINTEGSIWKEQRRFLHACLRWFGMTFHNNKNAQLEERIMGEVRSLLQMLSNKKDKPVDLNPLFAVSISNVICSLLMSVRFKFDDPSYKLLMSKIEEGFRLFGGIALVNVFPILRFFPNFLKEFRKIEQNKGHLQGFIQEVIDNHVNTYEENNKRDVLDCYLAEIKEAQKEGNGEKLYHGKEHNGQVRQVIIDMFTAGMESTKTTLHWSIIYMLYYPSVRKMVQNELDQVVGRDRFPTLDDLPYLPYTEATILEALRKSSVVPLGSSHSTTKDVVFRGYKIPKNTEIVPLIYAVNNDPDLWEKPEEFNPERFLDAEGRITKPEHFIPFGIGRRSCLGEWLAKMELFLFFSCILHTFDIEIPKGHTLPDLEGNFGITLTPSPYKVKLIERQLEFDYRT